MFLEADMIRARVPFRQRADKIRHLRRFDKHIPPARLVIFKAENRIRADAEIKPLFVFLLEFAGDFHRRRADAIRRRVNEAIHPPRPEFDRLIEAVRHALFERFPRVGDAFMQRAGRMLFRLQRIGGDVPRVHVGMFDKFRFHHKRPVNMRMGVEPAS